MPNMMAALLNIGGALCSTPQSLADAHYSSLCSNARVVGRKVNFASCKISLWGKSPQECIYSVPAQEMAKYRPKFGWLLLSDIAAVTKPRYETRWNLLGAPNYEPISAASGPYVGEILLFNKFFSDCRYMRRYSPTKLCDGAQTAIF